MNNGPNQPGLFSAIPFSYDVPPGSAEFVLSRLKLPFHIILSFIQVCVENAHSVANEPVGPSSR